MIAKFNILVIILLFGSLNLLSFLLIANPLKVNRKANIGFGVFMFLWSTFWIDEILNLAFGVTLSPVFAISVSFIQFLTPVIYFFSVLFFVNPGYKFHFSDAIYLLLPAVFLTVVIFQETSGETGKYKAVLVGMIILQSLFYGFYSYVKIRKHQKQILDFASDTTEIDLKWLEYILFLVLSIIIVVSIYNVTFSRNYASLPINALMLITVFGVAFFSLKQKEIFPVRLQQGEEILEMETINPSSEVRRKVLADNDLVKLKSKLNRLMQEQKPFRDPEMNLIKLAEMMNLTPHQLSYLINHGFNENFFQYVNKFRVEMAKEMIAQGNMNNYSMLGIAFESGFNSKTAFNSTFKKITNQTPSEYRKSGPFL